ncbi:energy transducer TonB [Azospirillum sp. A39]|uniref:energy transducer TonB n=1 Tax=Azospirillum sp. A39 TaxID=3462279 RepID=UPI0040466542
MTVAPHLVPDRHPEPPPAVRERLAVALGGGVSLALHAAVLAAVLGAGGTAAPPMPPVIGIDLVAPPAAAPAAPAGDGATAAAGEPVTGDAPAPEPSATGATADTAPDATAEAATEPEPTTVRDAVTEAPPDPHDGEESPAAAAAPPPPPRAKPPPPRTAAIPKVNAPAAAAPARTPGPAAAPPDAAQAGAGGGAAAAGPSRSAAPVDAAPPPYPPLARRRGLEGRVVLTVRVSPAGRAESVDVLVSSGHAILDAAARDAARGWRYRPALDAGIAVAAALEIPVQFRLED